MGPADYYITVGMVIVLVLLLTLNPKARWILKEAFLHPTRTSVWDDDAKALKGPMRLPEISRTAYGWGIIVLGLGLSVWDVVILNGWLAAAFVAVNLTCCGAVFYTLRREASHRDFNGNGHP